MCCAMQESLWVHLNFVEQKTLLRSDLLWGQKLSELEFFRFPKSSCTNDRYFQDLKNFAKWGKLGKYFQFM